ASIPDRWEVPAIAEMATELRLATLGLAPFVSELPVAEPLLAAELRTRRVLCRSKGEKFLQARLESRLGPRLVDFFLGLLLGSFSSAISGLLRLLRDVDSVLEDARIESANAGGLLDVGGRLTDRFDVRAGEEHLVSVHLDLRVSEDPRLPRELLPEEILDDELRPLHGGLHRKVAVDDLHFVREALSDPDDHVPQVGREGTDESRLLPPRIFAANGGLLAFHIDAQPRVEQAAPKRVPARGHDDEVTVDPELDSVRDLDGLFQ